MTNALERSERLAAMHGQLPPTGATTWQEQRTMTAASYRAALKALHLNTASAGRYLGVSTRTSHRFGRGEAEIPEPCAMLLRALIELKITPIVPSWAADRNKHW